MPKCNPRAHGATFGCDREARSTTHGSLCMAHYMQQRRNGALMVIEARQKRRGLVSVFFWVRQSTYDALVAEAERKAAVTRRRNSAHGMARELLETPQRRRLTEPIRKYGGALRRALSVTLSRKAHGRLVREHGAREPGATRRSGSPVAAEIVERWAEQKAKK